MPDNFIILEFSSELKKDIPIKEIITKATLRKSLSSLTIIDYYNPNKKYYIKTFNVVNNKQINLPKIRFGKIYIIKIKYEDNPILTFKNVLELTILGTEKSFSKRPKLIPKIIACNND